MDKFLAIFQGFKVPAIPDISGFNIKSNELLLIVLAILVLAFLIDLLLVNSIFGRSYRIFVGLGVIIHEFSHALLCLLMGAKITKIALFDKDGGSVEHTKPLVPIIGQVLISLAPFYLGAIAIYFLSLWIGLKQVDLGSISLTFDGAINFFRSLIGTINFSDYKNWIIIYLVLSIAVTMTPSKQDIKNVALSIIFIAAVVYSIYHFTAIRFSFAWLPMEKITVLLSTVLVLLILSLVLSIIVFGLSKLIGKRRVRY